MGTKLVSIAIKRLQPSKLPTSPVSVYISCCCTNVPNLFAELQGFWNALFYEDVVTTVLFLPALPVYPACPLDKARKVEC